MLTINKLQSYPIKKLMFSRGVYNHTKMIIWLSVENLTDAGQIPTQNYMRMILTRTMDLLLGFCIAGQNPTQQA